jgi:hypothetical protein
LNWDERLADIANKEGEVLVEDCNDSTMKVKFTSCDPPISAWLPTSELKVVRQADEVDAQAEDPANSPSASGGYSTESASPAP